MSDKALLKVYFLPFVMILLLKLLCVKLCLIITSVTILALFKCLLLLRFISYQEQHSKHLSQCSYQRRQNPGLWRTELLYAFLFIIENNPHTFKCTRCICSALPIARKFFLLLAFCFAHSSLHCHNWIHKTVLYIFLFYKWNILQEESKNACTEVIEESPVLKKDLLLSIMKNNKFWHYMKKVNLLFAHLKNTISPSKVILE